MTWIFQNILKQVIFTFCRQTIKNCLCAKLKSIACFIFFLERALRYLEGVRTIIGHLGTRRIFYGYQNEENPQMKISKNAIFQNYLKIELKELWYRFQVQNASKTPQGSISGHILCVRSIPAELSKIGFLAKIMILTISNGIITCPSFGRKWPKM